MNKATTVVGIVITAGIASGAYTLWRVAEQLSSTQPVAAPATDMRVSRPPAPAAQRGPIPGRAASPALPDTSLAAAELSPDEQSPFGHAAGEQPQHGSVEFAGVEASEPANVPTTTEAENAVLEDARATLQTLLENPDPSVRSEAAAILERIDSRPR